MKIPKDKPVYKLTEPFFDPHDNWHPEGKVIAFCGTPNQGMIPLNDKARTAYDDYMDKLDAGKRAWCEAQVPPVGFVAHERIYEEPDEGEVVDVSREVGGLNQPTQTIRLGRSKPVGEAATALN